MKMRALKKAQRMNESPEVLFKPAFNKKSMELTKEIAAGVDYADYLISRGKDYEKKKKELIA